jgi:hypothetical protein
VVRRRHCSFCRKVRDFIARERPVASGRLGREYSLAVGGSIIRCIRPIEVIADAEIVAVLMSFARRRKSSAPVVEVAHTAVFAP